jgi:putative endonuclease
MWWVYIIRCADSTLYTGISTDVRARVEEHNLGKGAKYTRGRGPCVLVADRYAGTKSNALKLEHHIKKQSASCKLDAILKWCFFHGPFKGEKCEHEH